VLKGFREFITRGNVIDLAVAVVIGTAFTAVVTAITESLVQPIIAALGGGNVMGLTAGPRCGKGTTRRSSTGQRSSPRH
jgi:large conductance mechanosensitive channel